MENETPRARVILLLTNHPVLPELIRQRIEELSYLQDSFPDATSFVELDIVDLRSMEDARTWFGAAAPTGNEAALVILDPLVSANSNLQAGHGGQAPIEFLGWLSSEHPVVPVLIASPAPAEDLQREVLGRPRTGLWLMGSDDPDEPDGSADFAEALAGLAVESPRDSLRYTISVGDEAARYVVMRGNYKIASTTAIAYGIPNAIESVLRRIRRFYSSDQTVSRDNADTIFFDAGNKLYDLLMRKTIGPGIIGVLGGKGAAGVPQIKVNMDLRFEIKVGSPDHDEMFNLPFEFMSEDSEQDANRCFCSRVPMARRLNLGPRLRARGSGRTQGFEAQKEYRMLFMSCDVGNTPMLRLDRDRELRRVGLNYLRNIELERKTLRECGMEGGARRISALIELGNGTSPSVGVRLRDELRRRLKTGGFDIFHFSGHSVILPSVQHGPLLVLPDEPPYALAVPICEVAQWLNEGNCKLMVLASCESVSVVTVTETMRGGAEGILGFRWEVDDKKCAEFFDRFYRAYFRQGSSLAESFRDACIDTTPVETQLPQWASAVAVLRD
ncbi:CHAT domain-containing protein [Paraburkholderia sp. JHI869]|uniref:CHAT domain-containing protein n=1 Tax=Paraburkholderia sp. JHI869 TaxID=3112959 RepID=UPI00316D5F41